MKKKVFVIGGLGFIGHRIVRKLLDKNMKVIIFDVVNTYMDLSKTNYYKILNLRLKHIGKKPIIIQGDIRNKFELYEAMEKHRPDYVIHLASIPIASIARKHKEETVAINLNGTINVAECSGKIKSVKRLIYISSSMVYGDFIQDPVKEEDSCNPKELYGATKLCGEILVKSICTTYNKEYAIIRPSAVNGFGAGNDSVLQLFCQKAIRNEMITIKGDGKERLDFSHVDDVAEGIVLAMLSKEKNYIYNITKGSANSILDLVEIIKKRFPNITVQFAEADNVMPKRGTLDISKAKKLLGYKPTHILKDCVDSYSDFYLELEK